MEWESEQESLAFAKFKAIVEDINVTDAEKLRFFRARNHDLDKAEDMLRKSIAWRAEVGFDDALNWTMSDAMKENFPYYFDGVDKDGRLVFYFPVGRWEVRKMIYAGWKSEMERNIYYTMAQLFQAVNDSKMDQFDIIIDLAELTYWKIAHYETVQIVLKVFREYEQNFPERLYRAIVINAPWVLNVIFPLIKPLLTGRILQKVFIFDNNSDKYMPQILDLVPKHGIPSGFQDYYNEQFSV